jgi:hypothetical protein
VVVSVAGRLPRGCWLSRVTALIVRRSYQQRRSGCAWEEVTASLGFRIIDGVFSPRLEPLEASLGRPAQCLEASCVSSARCSSFYDRGKQGDVHLGGGDHRLELGEALRGTRHGMVPIRLAVDRCTTYQVRASSRRDPPCMWQAPAHASESFMRGRLLRRLAWT